MTAFAYADSADPIRDDLALAHRAAWSHLAAPGTWLDGAERVAIADETRRALECALCRDRKQALTPAAVEGTHDHAGRLPDEIVEQVHRVTTDPARLTERWLRGLTNRGHDAERYVETLGVLVITISIDRFHRALGLPLEPLPNARSGAPTRQRPEDIVTGEAWVPMQTVKAVAEMAGLPRAPYVLRALSLVPAEVEAWMALSAAQYLAGQRMMSEWNDVGRALDRAQIELVAGRVSAVHECFY